MKVPRRLVVLSGGQSQVKVEPERVSEKLTAVLVANVLANLVGTVRLLFLSDY